MSVYPLSMIFLDDIIASSPTLTLLKFKVINQFLEVAHIKNPNAQHELNPISWTQLLGYFYALQSRL